jgi:hypothetical protein
MFSIFLYSVAAYMILYPIQAFIVWIYFLAIMDLKKARNAGTLTNTSQKLGYIALLIGYLLDFIFNITSSILFLEPPRELLFTARVSRHISEPGYRGTLARWACSNLLEPFDKGHCS